MITSILQMLVFVASAIAFAWYVLKVDKRESKPKGQYEFHYDRDDEHERRGAAMSRL